MCLGMNTDPLAPASAVRPPNRNFEGRQGTGTRTHLVRPVAAATAVTRQADRPGRPVSRVIFREKRPCRSHSLRIPAGPCHCAAATWTRIRSFPAEYLKRVTRSGFGDGLFAAWRADPEFVL